MTNIQAINLLKGLEQSLDDYCELNDEGKTAFRMAIAALELFGNAEQLPSAQPETHEERTETHGVCLDAIDRQATLDWLKNEWNGMITSLFDGIKALPSAQPELPEWAQKVEEYRKSAPSFVRNQLVWALYQTWKEYDGQLVHQRGKENR